MVVGSARAAGGRAEKGGCSRVACAGVGVEGWPGPARGRWEEGWPRAAGGRWEEGEGWPGATGGRWEEVEG